jgi:hypothetical protein
MTESPRERLIKILNKADSDYCCHDRCYGHVTPSPTPDIEIEADVLIHELVREYEERDACT